MGVRLLSRTSGLTAKSRDMLSEHRVFPFHPIKARPQRLAEAQLGEFRIRLVDGDDLRVLAARRVMPACSGIPFLSSRNRSGLAGRRRCRVR